MSDRAGDSAMAAALEERGYACVPDLLGADQCDALIDGYDESRHFRKRVNMARHGYGAGEYAYFDYPLPDLVAALRTRLYTALAPIANRWQARLGLDTRFPGSLAAYLDLCHAAAQIHATPLLLKYGPGDFNRLHQDLYGPLVFPLQVAVLLSSPGRDFAGGEFILTEQRPRQQARAEVVALSRGDAVVFPVRERPIDCARGCTRVRVRHGVSPVRGGCRFVLGVIFHDAA